VASLPGGNTTLPLELSWRALDTGPRTNESTVDTYRALIGAQGVVAGWDYNTAFSYNENKITDDYTKGYLDAGRLAAAFNTGTINPLRPTPAPRLNY
jgi:iron complex outermembrane receptor protein